MAARIGLVLGAGGPVGHAYHAGTLAALAAAGWDARRASAIVGTSIGAITGALLRGGVAAGDLYARLTGEPVSAAGERLLAPTAGWPALVPELSRSRRRVGPAGSPRLLARLASHPWRARPGLLLAGLSPTGNGSVAPISDAFNRLFGGRWPSATMLLCAVDLDLGRRVVLGADREPTVDVGTAVAASSAVPSLFEPVAVAGRRLVDGGLHSPVNADVIDDATAGLDAIVVSAPMAVGGRPGRLGVDLPGRYANHRAGVRELAGVRARGCPVVVFEPTRPELAVMHYDAFELRYRPQVAAAAFASAEARIKLAIAGREPALALVLDR